MASSDAAAADSWSSYGRDLANSRSQPRPQGVGVGTASRLVERWARRQVGAVDGTTYSVTGSPAVVGGTAYYTDWTGRLTAVRLRTGRMRWSTKVSTSPGTIKAAVNSSPTVARGAVYVSALEGRVVAVSARTGAIRWSTLIDTHPLTSLYSSPAVSGHRLIVGVASAENFLSPGPYQFRGSVAALDTRTGRILWQTYTMPPDLAGRGGSVWGTAAVDVRRGLAYIGTGQAYSRPAGPLTDALLALRLKDGSLAWHRQFTRHDVYNAFGRGGWQGLRHRRLTEPVPHWAARRRRRRRQRRPLRHTRSQDRRHALAAPAVRRQPPRRHHDHGRGRPRFDLGRL